MRLVKSKDYIERLKALHPEIPEELIKKVISEGCMNIIRKLAGDHDIRLKSPYKKVLFQVYKYRPFKKKKNEKVEH